MRMSESSAAKRKLSAARRALSSMPHEPVSPHKLGFVNPVSLGVDSLHRLSDGPRTTHTLVKSSRGALEQSAKQEGPTRLPVKTSIRRSVSPGTGGRVRMHSDDRRIILVRDRGERKTIPAPNAQHPDRTVGVLMDATVFEVSL